jgi:hypothetical protein
MGAGKTAGAAATGGDLGGKAFPPELRTTGVARGAAGAMGRVVAEIVFFSGSVTDLFAVSGTVVFAVTGAVFPVGVGVCDLIQGAGKGHGLGEAVPVGDIVRGLGPLSCGATGIEAGTEGKIVFLSPASVGSDEYERPVLMGFPLGGLEAALTGGMGTKLFFRASGMMNGFPA